LQAGGKSGGWWWGAGVRVGVRVAKVGAKKRGVAVRFHILGPLEVLERDAVVALGGAKQRAVLAILLLHRGEVLSSERLIDALWGERPPATAAKTLQGYVSRLRRALGGGLLQTRGRGYQLALAPDQVDADEFERLASQGRAALSDGDPATAAQQLRQALGLWRGPPLVDFAYEAFAQAEIARLQDARLAALEDRFDADLALGCHAEVVGALEALIVEHPYRERLRAQLMLALYRCDRQADALQAYRNARHALVEELGIGPGRAMQELEREILMQDPKLEWTRVAMQQQGSVESGELRPRADGASTGGSFVGRERELAELLGGLESALERRPLLFLVAGEPGIGKSRLADEMTVLAQARGARVLWGRCWEAGGAPAYWPWAQALRAYIRDGDKEQVRVELGGGAADVAQMLPELYDLFPDLPPAPSLDPDGARFRLFDSTASFLRAVSEARPLVLVIDDLHAADTPSLLLLRFLARELRQARIVLLAAYRDTEVRPDALSVTLAELRREPIARLVRLGGLALPEVARCIELIVGVPPSQELAVAIHGETEGNPLFVGELVRLLTSEGRLEEVAGMPWRASIPQGMREVIALRLHHLSPDCRRLLAVASVLGREFRLDALERLSERSGDELLDLLDEAMAARVVGDSPAGRSSLRFSHALIRDSLYSELGRNERLRLHRRAAEALETLYGRARESHLAELAHHFFEAAPAGGVEKAVEYASQAGDRAAALLAFEEAARLYEMALQAVELSPRTDEPTQCELLLALGDARARGGEPSWKETFLRAADVARALNAPEQLARAALGYGGRFVWFRAGNDRQLIPLLEDALEALPGENRLRVRLSARLAGALRDQRVSERRAALCWDAVECARRLGDPATLAYALEGSYAALSWPRDTAAWLAIARELTELAEEVGDKELAYHGHTHAGGVAMVRGDIPAAESEFAISTAIAQELRQPAFLWSQASPHAAVALLAGRFEEAEQLITQVQQGPGGHGTPGGVFDTTFQYVACLQGWALRRERGDLAETLESIERYVAEYPTFFIFRCILANIHSQLGLEEDARQELERIAAGDFAALEVGTEWHFGANLLAEVCAFLGDARHAAHLYDVLLPYGDCNVWAHPEFSLGSASRYLGLLARTMSRWDDAALHFELALKMNASMGSQPWVAHTQEDFARMLVARGDMRDRTQAAKLIGDALTTYRALGMENSARTASTFEQTLRGAANPA
jgi:DNA-binding SARP family transcriptional activator